MSEDDKYTVEDARQESLYFRLLESGDAVAVYPLFLGAQLALVVVELGTIADCYYYPSVLEAIAAAGSWDGTAEPLTGWYRHPPSGRRRVNGDPTKETVRP